MTSSWRCHWKLWTKFVFVFFSFLITSTYVFAGDLKSDALVIRDQLADCKMVMKLAKPTGLQFPNISATKLSLSWNAVVGATQYQVRRTKTGSSISTSFSTTSPYFNDSGLQPGTDYTYIVSASGICAKSIGSDAALVKTSIVPTAVLTITPTTNYDFGNVVFTANASMIFTLTNSGSGPALAIAGVAPANNHFAYDNSGFPGGTGSPYCSATLAAGASCIFKMKYAPQQFVGLETSNALITYNNGSTSQTINLSLHGTGTLPPTALLSITPAGVYDFGNVDIISTTNSAQTFTITNVGLGAASNIVGTDPINTHFMYSGGAFPGGSSISYCTTNTLLGPGMSCDFSIMYDPQVAGLESDSVIIRYDDGVSQQNILQTFQGTGVSVSLPKQILWGAYYGNQGWDMATFQAYETWVGKKASILNLFADWDPDPTKVNNLFTIQLPNIWGNGNIPMITWEPYVTTSEQATSDMLSRINQGIFDTYIMDWATRLKQLLNADPDRKVYMRFGHEMNGNWYGWSARGALPATATSPALTAQTTQDYKDAWIRIHDLFVQQGISSTQIQWVWCVNVTDVGAYQAEQYYPTDAYVDWITIDGYNWQIQNASGIDPTPLFDPMVQRMRLLSSKPLGVTEFSTSSDPPPLAGTVADKAAWITKALTYFINNNIKMAVIFNEDKERDWAVFRGQYGDQIVTPNQATPLIITDHAYSAYQSGMQDPAWISLPMNQITQTLFEGH